MLEDSRKYMYTLLNGKKLDIQDSKTLKSAVLLVNSLVKKGVSLSDAVSNITSSGHPHIVVNFTKFMKDTTNKDLYINIQNELLHFSEKQIKKQKILEENKKGKSKIVTEKIGSIMQDAIDRKNGFYPIKARALAMKFNHNPNEKIEDQKLRLAKATERLKAIIQKEKDTSNITNKIVKDDKDY